MPFVQECKVNSVRLYKRNSITRYFMMSNEKRDYKLAARQLRSGKPLFGKDGALALMLERILNVALEDEMDTHLSDESRESGNRRNDRMSKTVQIQYGEVTVDTPRDRARSFVPQTVRKCETILAECTVDKIIGMYVFGTSTHDISRNFEYEFNATCRQRRSVPSPTVCCLRSGNGSPAPLMTFMSSAGSMPSTTRSRTRATVPSPVPSTMCFVSTRMYTRSCQACTPARSGGAYFWFEVLTDLRNLGVEDIMICCVDGLKGFPDTIGSVFTDTTDFYPLIVSVRCLS